MIDSNRLLAVLKIAMAFGVMAFSVALGAALVSGVDFLVALYRALLAAGVFIVFGGLCSLLLAMFFHEP